MKYVIIMIKIVLAILLMLCLLRMPYSYYQVVRFTGFIGFMLLALLDCKGNSKVNTTCIVYFALALLFQPFIKITLGRTVWNILDVLISIVLIVSIKFSNNNKKY